MSKPASKRNTRGNPIFTDGEYSLYPSSRPGRNHIIVYKPESGGREQVTSAGTTDVETAIAKVREKAGGAIVSCVRCKECGQPVINGTRKVADCIAAYITAVVEKKKKPQHRETIKGRLRHLTDYMAATYSGRDLTVSEVDDSWCEGFRDWMTEKGHGDGKEYSDSTVEAPLVHLSAAIKLAKERKLFKTRNVNGLNRKVTFRADVKQLAAMLDYCINPAGQSDKVRAQRRRERTNLANYIRMAIATWARPEAIIEIDCATMWDKETGMLCLLPPGEKQTTKHRPTVPIVPQLHWLLNDTPGKLFSGDPTQSTWQNMAKTLGLPEGAGSKSIRRSMARLARRPLKEHQNQVAQMMGHKKKTMTSIYAGEDDFDADDFTEVLALTSAIVDEIEALCPGAINNDVSGANSGAASKVVSLAA